MTMANEGEKMFLLDARNQRRVRVIFNGFLSNQKDD
jgi:hypothetical protein